YISRLLIFLVSMLIYPVIVVVLREYDDLAAPNWPMAITLNTFLAFFTSLAKLALMVPVTSGLGQLRWLWFSEPRRLTEFELFEQAYRGIYGSCKLLFSFTGG
ncbi:hypothetical protein GQ53DRAFT_666947, partial [Thozetella sp. PMI_491]